MSWIVPAMLLGATLLMVVRWAIWRGFSVRRVMEKGSPADCGLTYREVAIPTVGGKRLFGWVLDAAPKAPLVVMVHGWGANAEGMLPLAAPLVRHGLSVLLFDARGHGKSDAEAFSSMPRFAEDIAAVLDWVRQQDGDHVRAVAVLGHSVGGAAALLAASRRVDVDAVISLSAFDHPERVMKSFLARVRLPYRPLGWLVCRYVERVIGHRFDSIAPVATISKVRCPVLIGHGADDALVLPEAAHAIHARAADHTCEIAVLEGAGHDHPVCYEQLGFLITDFLDRALKSNEETTCGRAVAEPPGGVPTHGCNPDIKLLH